MSVLLGLVQALLYVERNRYEAQDEVMDIIEYFLQGNILFDTNP